METAQAAYDEGKTVLASLNAQYDDIAVDGIGGQAAFTHGGNHVFQVALFQVCNVLFNVQVL